MSWKHSIMAEELNNAFLSELSLNSREANTSPGSSIDEFNDEFSEIVNSVHTLLPEKERAELVMLKMWDWLKVVLIYNVPLGKQIRARLLLMAYKQLVESPTLEESKRVRMMGWIIEIMQAASLIADDIMDNGISRRANPCWYLVNQKGNIAFNDVLLLEHTTYQLLRKHFGHLKIYPELINLVNEIAFRTVLGQSLDTRVDQTPNFGAYTKQMYRSIVIYKTAYYTVYLPVALAMTLAGISKKSEEYKQTWDLVEDITLKIGELFQVQDDYFDCFVQENKLGKVGTDIEEGKCTWLFVTAVELCNDKELVTLKSHYGSVDTKNVAVVKRLYEMLGLKRLFLKYKDELREEVDNLIQKLEHPKLQIILNFALEKIYQRHF